jgi:hypothetical protein
MESYYERGNEAIVSAHTAVMCASVADLIICMHMWSDLAICLWRWGVTSSPVKELAPWLCVH